MNKRRSSSLSVRAAVVCASVSISSLVAAAAGAAAADAVAAVDTAVAAVATVDAANAAGSRASACGEIAAVQLPDVQITRASAEPSPEHCKVSGVIGEEIHFELLLPTQWNGRFVMGGGGGFAGRMQNSALADDVLNKGYATVGTDTGHQGTGVDASWAHHNLTRLVNFGHLAVHRTAVTAKALIAAHYGRAAEYAYFTGCSRGGGQALMEAQRYPDDFDGIIAGAPAYDWMGIASAGLQNMQHIYPDPQRLDTPVLSPANRQLLRNAIIAQCDAADGISDGYLEDPRRCDYSVDTLPACVDEQAADDCVTTLQRSAINRIYEGPVDDAGNSLFYGRPLGGETEQGGWQIWITGGQQPVAPGVPSLDFGFALGIAKYFVFDDPDWTYAGFDFAQWEKQTARFAALLSATNPDLSAFRKRGGKLLIWHGWSDPALSAKATVGYYDRVLANDATAAADTRLYLLPGVLHCRGGLGADRADFLGTIRQWVEQQKAPDTIEAHFSDEQGGSRPLCPYPQSAKFIGNNPREPASYQCAAAAP